MKDKKADRAQLVQKMHQEALAAAAQFFRSEARVLDILQRLDAERAYRDFGHTSLMTYAVKELKLSESTALNLINVARKSVQVPELKREIESGELSVCMARKIVPVLTKENQAGWIEMAKTLTTRALEREVARVRPQEATPERIKYVTEDRVAMSLGLDQATLVALKRVQNLESQRQMRAVSLEETVGAMCAVYLEKNDPLAKAKRAALRAKTKLDVPAIAKAETANIKTEAAESLTEAATPNSEAAKLNAKPITSDVTRQTPASNDEPARSPLSASLAHQINLRDGSQCTHRDPTGNRCEQQRWLQFHHVLPVSQGGKNELDNLATLCAAHHQLTHLKPCAA